MGEGVAERERERGGVLISIFLSIATVKGLLLLCAFLWVIAQHLNFIYGCFGTLLSAPSSKAGRYEV